MAAKHICGPGQRWSARTPALGHAVSASETKRMIRDDIKAAMIAAMKGGDKAGTRNAAPRLRRDQESRHRGAHRLGARRTMMRWSPKSCRK